MTGHRLIHASKKVAVLPAEEDLIDFNHSAAGHEGMSSNASGSLVIKPCTQAEIDFYESANDHPEFQVHMPTFMGKLSLHNDQSIAPLLDGKEKSFTASHLTAPDTPVNSVSTPGSQNASLTSATVAKAAKRTSWKPSGGKRLVTGLAIVLENAAAGFKRPNILDAKLGARLWDDDAPEAKRRKLDEVSKETTSSSLGFRVAGMKTWLGEDVQPVNSSGDISTSERNVQIRENYKCYDKHYGREFNADNVKDAFITYLGGRNAKNGHLPGSLKRKGAKTVAKRILRDLENIIFVLEEEESRMYSASVLMVYEGDEDALEKALAEEDRRDHDDLSSVTSSELEMAANGFSKDSSKFNLEPTDISGEAAEDDDDDEDEIEDKVTDVRLIDFAHARWTPGHGPDENALHGVRSLVKIFKEILED